MLEAIFAILDLVCSIGELLYFPFRRKESGSIDQETQKMERAFLITLGLLLGIPLLICGLLVAIL